MKIHASHGKWNLDNLERRYGVFRLFKFAVASGIGFAVNEVILLLGVFAIYHTVAVPNLLNSSLIILGLDVLALGTGNTVAFLINERVTVKVQAGDNGMVGRAWFKRWAKYQLSALMGSSTIVAVQLALFATISLSPVFGNIVGAVISYPLTYVVSMRVVWGVHPFRG